MPDDALFDPPPGAVRHPAEPEPKLSADRRRTLRQAAALARGVHPLSPRLRLHPDAAPANDRKAPGLRCGGCRHLEPNAWHYLKCWFGDDVRISHGAATDCRGWWPACRDYQPREGT